MGRDGDLPGVTPAVRDWILGDFKAEPHDLWPQVAEDLERIFGDPKSLCEIEKLEEEMRRAKQLHQEAESGG